MTVLNGFPATQERSRSDERRSLELPWPRSLPWRWHVSQSQAERSSQEASRNRAGEKLDEFGRAIRDGFEKAGETVVGGINKTGETVREGLVKARDSVQGMGVYSRVYSRIHWDKTLHANNLLLRAEGGVITLRGVVPDDAAKTKAVTSRPRRWASPG